MIDVYSEHYWQTEFTITNADIDRLKSHIVQTRQAHELTTLVTRIIRGRLRHGHEVSPAAIGVDTTVTDQSVRLWDPSAEWHLGDHVIVAVREDSGYGMFAPYVGEITSIKESNVYIHIDRLNKIKIYSTSATNQGDLIKWRDMVKNLVAARRNADDLKADLELIMLEYGDRITSQLLDALRADKCFVRLAGRWFLRELAYLPSEIQVTDLAWTLLDLQEPQPTDVLISKLSSPVPEGDPGLFGLYLAMRNYPDIFENAAPGQRPRWKLIGPPPGPKIVKHAAYDPDTYHVLCESGEEIDDSVARRLWELGLFGTICTPSR